MLWSEKSRFEVDNELGSDVEHLLEVVLEIRDHTGIPVVLLLHEAADEVSRGLRVFLPVVMGTFVVHMKITFLTAKQQVTRDVIFEVVKR